VADTLPAPGGRRLAALAAEIDQKLAPQSSTLPGVRVRLTVTLKRERGTAANAVGILPGTDEKLRDDAIVIGAHYDHLGRAGEGSLAPEQVWTSQPVTGDNAPCTAALRRPARACASAGGAPRTVIFATFAGEEMGLLGSAHYVRHPALPLDRAVLMVNLDMVGRLRNDKVFVGGADSAKELRQVLDDAARGLGLT